MKIFSLILIVGIQISLLACILIIALFSSAPDLAGSYFLLMFADAPDAAEGLKDNATIVAAGNGLDTAVNILISGAGAIIIYIISLFFRYSYTIKLRIGLVLLALFMVLLLLQMR